MADMEVAEPDASELHWLDRRVLVTGATGLVGSWLVEALLERSAVVTCVVRDDVRRSRFFSAGLAERVSSCSGPVEDQAFIERALGEYEIQTVFHLAAQTIVTIANRSPLSTFETNIRGTWNLLEACRRSPLVSEVVIASSDKAYGSQLVLPYTEDTPLQGTSPYDVSKSCADLIAQSYASTWGLPVSIARCGNFFGGGDFNFSRLVPGTIRDLLRGRAPVIRSDGAYIRDYLHVQDGVSAYLAIAESLARDPTLRGSAFNFSLEQPMTVLDMVREIAAVMDVPVEPVVLSEATSEIRAQYLDSHKARDLLGWKPSVGLTLGLAKTVDWYRSYLGAP
jgi:CDP-glucose 4,6-dehydratase